MQNESLQENTGYWKSVARLIQLYNLLVPSHLEDHLIAALSELLNPGPSGHQPLPGSFHKKDLQNRALYCLNFSKQSAPLKFHSGSVFWRHTKVLPLLHVSLTYQVSKPDSRGVPSKESWPT